MPTVYLTPLHKRLNNTKPVKINLLRGGTRSSKTYSLCQIMAHWLMTGQFTKHYTYKEDKAYIIRHTLPSLKRTVLEDFIDVLHKMECYWYVDYNKSNLVFSYSDYNSDTNTGGRRSIYFLPADDSEKLKGLSPGITWINEADSVSYDAFIALNLRTRHHLFADYNPSDPESWPKRLEDEWLPMEDDISLDISTFHDNPYLTKNVIKEIERTERVDLELYNVYHRGQWMTVQGLIFPNYQRVESIPADYDQDWYGIDFGYEDPTAIVRVVKKGMNLYLDELYYKPGALNNELAEFINVRNIRKIYGDAASPKDIEELRRRGVRIKAAKKGKDSIQNGINKIKQHHLFITERSVNMLMEAKRYKWKTDNEGELVRPSKPIDQYNHCFDSVRYAISYILNKKMRF